MNAAAPWTRVLLAPWQQRRNQGSMWLFGLLLVVVGLIVLGVAAILPARAAAVLVVVVLSVPLFGGWSLLVLGLLHQNHPNTARLVPGQLRTLRCVLFVAWLVLTLLAALVGWAFGHPWSLAAGAALLLLLLMWVVRFPVLGLFLSPALALSVQWVHAPVVEAALRSFSEAGQGLALTAIPALLAGASASSFLLLQGGGAKHAQAYGRRAKQLAALRTGGGSPAFWRAGGSVLGRWFGNSAASVYQPWLAHVSTRRTGAVLPRALLALGPTIHWTGLVGLLPGLGAVVAVVMFILWQIDAATDSVAAWGLSIGVLTFAVNAAIQARAAIHATRREQALMMLLPGMPRGRALNRALAQHLSLQFIISWALGVLVCALLFPLREQLAWFAIYAAACLPLGALLWTDWSRVKAPTAASAVAPLLLVMLLALVAIALQAWAGVPAWACVLVFVAAAVLLMARRAQRVTDAPSAFPAGRFG
jgi:hypothetical protein